jgi:hypothetical protein
VFTRHDVSTRFIQKLKWRTYKHTYTYTHTHTHTQILLDLRILDSRN